MTTERAMFARMLNGDGKEPEQDKIEAAMVQLLEAIGHDEGAHHLNTPARAAKAWKDRLAGYEEDPREHLRTAFPIDGEPSWVIQTGITIQSTCAHHLLPFTGHATVAYLPNRDSQSVVGLSKLSRVIHGYAKRMQVQERIGEQTATALHEVLDPQAVVVMITATHDCMRLRGVREADASTTTVSTRGDVAAGLQLVAGAHKG